MDASHLREQLAAKVRNGETIVVSGAGNGLSAKCAEIAGADAVVVYNSGRYRMAGRGSLAGLMPYGDANQIVVEMAREIVPVLTRIPVLAGVCGTDPFRDMGRFLDELSTCGVTGVQNFPTVGLIDGVFRQHLEATGMAYRQEVDMIHLASAGGLFTMPYVFDAAQASAMVDAGADLIVAHLGLTAGGTIGAPDTREVSDVAATLQGIVEAVDSRAPILCHGGPITEPGDLRDVIAQVPTIAGFVGASSIERLASEQAIVQRIREFREVTTGP